MNADSNSRPAPLFGLILAGGKSRRMGKDKATLRQNGRSQLAHIADLLARHTERVFVSTRAEQQHESERAQFEQIIDQVSAGGPVAGILSAMIFEPEADWLVVACDLPNIDDETLAMLRSDADAEAPFIAFRSHYDDLPEPLCAIYRRHSRAIVQQFVDEGIHCPRKILIRSATRLLQQPNPHSLDNVNTPADLADSVLQEGA